MVPDGYISDDEGLGEHDGLERKRSLENGGELKAIKRDSKRRYIEKQAIISGVFIQGLTPDRDGKPLLDRVGFKPAIAPLTVDARLQWMVPLLGGTHCSFNPWKDVPLSGQGKFVNLYDTAADKATRIPFDDSMLPDLAKVLQPDPFKD